MDKMNARKKAARAARLRKQRTRRALLTLCLMLAVAVVSVGGTIAWLTDKTDKITNTFTASDVDVELAETKTNFKMVPGATIEKDPQVTIKANSEACWVFVKIEESANYDSYLEDYEDEVVAAGWTKLENGVFYREQAATTSDVTYSVINGDKVTVKSDVTKTMMDNIENKTVTNPTLSFTAYAIQKASFDTAAAAWAEVSK